MSEIEHEDPTAGDNRRSAIKKLGAGAAIAWSAPVLSTAMTKAGAASPMPGCDIRPGTDPCGAQLDCGGGCFCNMNVTDGVPNGLTYCTVPTGCGNADCDNDSDCAPGEVCQATCCATTKCFVVCDATMKTKVAAGTYASATRA